MKINPTMNPRVEKAGKRLAKYIEKALPANHGFALLMFEFGAPDGEKQLSYISNADREDMIATMKDFIARHEGRAMPEPKGEQ